MEKNFNLKLVFILVLIILIFPVFAFADSRGQTKTFFIESLYDFNGRESATATLQSKSDKLYFYIDNDWWNKFGNFRQEEIKSSLSQLAQAFEEEIYPTLTSTFGSEWKPGIDGKEEITVLFHQMKEKAAGYFNSGDEYSILQNTRSNEREMVYLNADYITDDLIDSFLAHEFIHLITFNQKERKEGVTEEIWLNEARAEYAPTLLGYDLEYKGSNLERRVEEFLDNPSDSLTEWRKKSADYGVLNIFTQYLVGQYGIEVLSDSLKSDKIGIESLNEALEENGFDKDFSRIFRDWTIAVLVNDCSFGEEYCYKKENLENLRVIPSLNFLPLVIKTSLRIEDSIKDWSGRWYRLMGGRGDLEVSFEGDENVDFHVFYLACKENEECILSKMVLDNQQKETITISGFGEEYSYLTLILFTQEKKKGFDSLETAHPFSFEASAKENEEENEKLIEELKARIIELQAQIAVLQAKIAAILKEKIYCGTIENNLYYDLKSSEVSCLQEFLKAQGAAVYPEGLITGYFGPLTQAAVIRFQEKYASEILTPLGLNQGTGFVGFSTRSKINSLLGG